MERRLAFGNVAELYDRVRPSYPASLVEDVVGFAAPCTRALEVGAGTGKATRLFCERGVEVTAIEPSAEMADVGRHNLPGVNVVESDFEGFDGAGAPFDLVYSAQAWHWVAPEVRYTKARRLLRDGGALALFWNRARWEGNRLRNQLREAYERTVPDFGPTPGPMYPSTDTPPELWGDWKNEIAAADGFGAPDIRAYNWSQEYSTADYLDLIQTHSDHIVLGPARLNRLLNAVGDVLDRAGGRFELQCAALLLLVRAR